MLRTSTISRKEHSSINSDRHRLPVATHPEISANVVSIKYAAVTVAPPAWNAVDVAQIYFLPGI